MTDASSASMDQSEDKEDEQEMDRKSQRLVLPEDGYEWKKYGQKFIKNIGKFRILMRMLKANATYIAECNQRCNLWDYPIRSYFKCQRENCTAKKKAEWSNIDSGDIRIVYEGGHAHGSMTDQNSTSAGSSQGTSSSANANQYNLLSQVLRKDHHHHQSTSHRPPQD